RDFHVTGVQTCALPILELERGLELVNRALEIQPDNPAYIDTRGWIYFMMGRYPEARDEIERAIALMPDDPTLTDHLVDIYEKLRSEERRGGKELSSQLP